MDDRKRPIDSTPTYPSKRQALDSTSPLDLTDYHVSLSSLYLTLSLYSYRTISTTSRNRLFTAKLTNTREYTVTLDTLSKDSLSGKDSITTV